VRQNLIWRRRHVKRTIIAISLVLLLASVLVMPASAAAGESSGVVYHRVRYGETLYRIGLRYGTTVQGIAQLNGIANPNRIYAGQVLRIYPGAASTHTVYVVRWGDTLSAIARQFGVSPWAIAEANRITNLNRIYTGQRLVIPK
jgi:LysM repeat protein